MKYINLLKNIKNEGKKRFSNFILRANKSQFQTLVDYKKKKLQERTTTQACISHNRYKT